MKPSIAIIGGGTSSLMLASQLDSQKFNITIFERNHALGRKFLVAGDGGLNLTHSEPADVLAKRYTPNSFFRKAIQCFNNTDLRNWLHESGIETFIGSSKRVFPVKGTKPITVLNCFLEKLAFNNVVIKTQHEWMGWTHDNELIFSNLQNKIILKPDICVFAMGGSSWKITGSVGNWTSFFREKDISIIPFLPSNCGYKVAWPTPFIDLAEGRSLKNIAIKCGNLEKKGEIVITRFGLEGGALYALSPEIRSELINRGTASIFIDMKPSLPIATLLDKLKNKGNKSMSKHLQDELHVNDIQLGLLKNLLTKEQFTNPSALALKIKQLPLHLTDFAPLDEAISTVGGIDLNEIDEHYQLKKLPGNYAIGEMLDWDAPTGGYLLQACFSMGYTLAKHFNSKRV